MLIQKLLGRIKMPHLVNWSFRFWGNREYILYRGQRITRKQAYNWVKGAASGLHALGIKPGDVVALLLPSCPESVNAVFLPHHTGVVIVPLNPLMGEHDLYHVLKHCEARVVITRREWYGKQNLALLQKLRPDLPKLEYILLTDESGINEHDLLSMDVVIAKGKGSPPRHWDNGEITHIYYTSGTTGDPKGVVRTRGGNFFLKNSALSPLLLLKSLRCMLIPFSPYQMAGSFAVMGVLLSGGKMILMDRIELHAMWQAIEDEKIAHLTGSPTLFRLMLAYPGHEKFNTSSVLRITCSSEPLTPDLANKLYERFACPIENVYGTTECMLISWTTMDDSWETASSTVGKPVNYIELRIVDEARQSLPQDELGEIAIRTGSIMQGYYKNPTETARVLDDEGWYYTGDLGHLDEDGYLHLFGRKDDLIIRGGQNIYPKEIENLLQEDPRIRQAAIIGVPEPVSGQAVWAFIEPNPGAQLSPPDVLDLCRGQIAPYKIPAEVRIVDQLPRTGSNKVKKYVLRNLASQEEAV